MDAHIETVEKILDEMGLADIPRVLVFNKTDLVPTVIVENLSRRLNAVPVSAKNTDTLEGLLKIIETRLFDEKDRDGGR